MGTKTRTELQTPDGTVIPFTTAADRETAAGSESMRAYVRQLRDGIIDPSIIVPVHGLGFKTKEIDLPNGGVMVEVKITLQARFGVQAIPDLAKLHGDQSMILTSPQLQMDDDS